MHVIEKTSYKLDYRSIYQCPPEVVLLLVLLVSWMDLPKGEEFQVLEFFAGVGRIAAFAQLYGFKSGAIDITYGEKQFKARGKRSPLDINSDSGLLPPA